MAEITVRSWADVTANRRPSSNVPSDIKKVFHTGPVAVLRLANGPEGCNGVHCGSAKNYCREKECLDRQQDKLTKLKADNKDLAVDIDEYIDCMEGLLIEIANHCRTDSLYYPAMEVSKLALESALTEEVKLESCECVVCLTEYQKKGTKMLKKKLEAAKARYNALDEYRRAHDKEAIARTSDGYMNGEKMFTATGSARAKGFRAMRPA